MAQLFRPSANTLARFSLLLVALLPWVVIFAGMTISRSPANTNVSVPLAQPVPFSHKHHAQELGIDCRYCHTSVETSKFAGIPSTEICMTCHSQIWTNSPLLEPVRKSLDTNTALEWSNGNGKGWVRVNKVPDFVYFDHSIHIARGVSCNLCHGPVQEMQLTYKGNAFQMRWCLGCHRSPEKFLRTDEQSKGLSPTQQIFALYERISKVGYTQLDTTEKRLARGLPPDPTVEQISEGALEAAHRGIKKEHLDDCWICHR